MDFCCFLFALSLSFLSLSLSLPRQDFDFVVVVVVFSDIFRGLVFIFIFLAWRVAFICAKTADEAKKKENHGREFHFLFALHLLLLLLVYSNIGQSKSLEFLFL